MVGMLIAFASTQLWGQGETFETPAGSPKLETVKVQPLGLTLDMIPLLQYPYHSHLAAKDGNYLAQDEPELQTYYDLGLDYLYLENGLIRQQLGLPDGQGIMIANVKDDGEGKKNGFEVGDIVLSIDGEHVVTQYDFVIELSKQRGKHRTAKLKRNGKTRELMVDLTELTDETPGTHRYVLGVQVEPIDGALKTQLQTDGLAITSVTENSAAKKSGLIAHDVIVAIGDVHLSTAEGLRTEIKKAKGAPVTLEFVRNAKSRTVTLSAQKIEIDLTAPAFQNQTLEFVPKFDYTGRLQLIPQLKVHDRFGISVPLYEIPSISKGDGESFEQKIDSVISQLESLKSEMLKLKEKSKK